MKSGKLLVTGYISITVLLAVLLFFSFLKQEKSFLLSHSSVNNLNDNWTIVNGNTKDETAHLPINEQIKNGNEITIERDLPEDFGSTKHLLIRSSLQTLKVYLDDEIIYKLDFEDDKMIKVPIASLWNIVEIPENSAGKTISITLSSDFSRFNGVVNPIYYGSIGDLNLFIIKNDALPFFIAALIFLIGFMLCIIPLFIKTGQKSPLLFLGFFTIAISLWFMAESRMLQFFTGNKIILGGLAYMMLALAPAPFSIYIHEVVSMKFKKIYVAFAAAFSMEFIIILTLQLAGVCTFYKSLVLTHILMICFIIATIIIIAYEIIRNKNQQAKNIFYSTVFLTAFGISELLRFYMTRSTQVGHYFLIGVIFFISIQAITYLRQIQKQNIKSIEADMLRELAYKDYMTKGGNRLAFELDMERVFSDREKLKHTGLVYFDVDGLKKINDELGHIAGDEAIVFSCELINDVFGEYGNCYRIGGDEFAALLSFPKEFNVEQKIKSLIDKFNLKLEENKDKFEYSFSVSAGGVHFENKVDKDIKSMMSRADRAMYENKNRR